jgi:hypothetical protein
MKMASPIQSDSQSSLINGAGWAVLGQCADSAVVDMADSPFRKSDGGVETAVDSTPQAW